MQFVICTYSVWRETLSNGIVWLRTVARLCASHPLFAHMALSFCDPPFSAECLLFPLLSLTTSA